MAFSAIWWNFRGSAAFSHLTIFIVPLGAESALSFLDSRVDSKGSILAVLDLAPDLSTAFYTVVVSWPMVSFLPFLAVKGSGNTGSTRIPVIGILLSLASYARLSSSFFPRPREVEPDTRARTVPGMGFLVVFFFVSVSSGVWHYT